MGVGFLLYLEIFYYIVLNFVVAVLLPIALLEHDQDETVVQVVLVASS